MSSMKDIQNPSEGVSWTTVNHTGEEEGAPGLTLKPASAAIYGM